MSKNRRIRNARAVRPLFASLRKVPHFRDMKIGDVVRYDTRDGRPWMFWVRPNGKLTTDCGEGINGLIRRAQGDHSHWYKLGVRPRLTLLATGVMSEFGLMSLELKA